MITAEDILRDKAQTPISVSVDTCILEALKVMLEHNIGSILVTETDMIVGIWTERDLMRNTVSDGFDPKTARIGDYMSTRPITAPHTASLYLLLDKFLGLNVRHLLIEKEGNYIGLLGYRDVLRVGLTERSRELKELNSMVSWEYYENWKWKGK